jgi:hypothetical protein
MSARIVVVLVFVAYFLLAVVTAALLPVLDVKFGPRTVVVSDPNKRTLTLTPGDGDVWVCAPYDSGKSCKQARDVVAWLLRGGE